DEMSQDDIRQFSKMIHDSSKNLLNLLENLLEWSVLEQNKRHCKPEKTNLSEIIRKNIELFSPNCKKKGLSMANKVSPDTEVWADQNMVDTVVRNLSSNAIKYTPEGGTISYHSQSNDTHVTLEITDTGVGMDETTLNQLFKLEELRSRPGTGNEKGTGLGLLICRELIEKNNGTIEVKSTLGEGSTFIITLPKHPHNL
ncbi:HAMP domain-containing sensor histidine kinase, partial [Balneolaceae bacterium ANBcel3]|nr:HAMP domain-containing sensor histidine kinase [Balneolaceae bacterium ANBcel3]